MGKKTVVEKTVEEPTNGVLEPEDKAKEAIESLKVQLVEHQKQVEYHATMATKAQGALEVLYQLHPQDIDGEGS